MCYPCIHYTCSLWIEIYVCMNRMPTSDMWWSPFDGGVCLNSRVLPKQSHRPCPSEALMCLYFLSSLLNPSVARDAQPGTFPTTARNLKASLPSNRTWEGGGGSFLQSHLLLPPLSPHPAPCLLPCLGHRWNLHALPMSVILASYLAATSWPSTPFSWRTPLILSGSFSTSVCILPSAGCTLPVPSPLSLVPYLDLLGGGRH